MEFRVCVRCYTYNQASYIKDAMDGFCMQKTNFPYLCVVVDDCSKDDEQNVIKRYLDANFEAPQMQDESDDCERVLAKHKSNGNCYFLVVYLKYNHYSIRKAKKIYFKEWSDEVEYFALCEGDDYWIDDAKLQKQVNILDSNSDCTLCYHACINKFEEGFDGNKFDFGADVKDTYSFKDVVWSYNFQTATVLYRQEIVNTDYYHKLCEAGFSFGDNLLYYTAAHFGKLIGVNEKMSVYRRTKNGISNDIHKGKHNGRDVMAYINTLNIYTREERSEILIKKIYPFFIRRYMYKTTHFVDYIKMLLKTIRYTSFITLIKTLRYLLMKF